MNALAKRLTGARLDAALARAVDLEEIVQEQRDALLSLSAATAEGPCWCYKRHAKWHDQRCAKARAAYRLGFAV